MAIELIEEAVTAGARRFKACAVLEIDVRTLQRWQKALTERDELADRRKAAACACPDDADPNFPVRRHQPLPINATRSPPGTW